MKKMDCAALREAVETWPELDRLRQLREAIALWPVSIHDLWCDVRADCACNCGHAEAKEARATARKLVGLMEDEP